MLSVVITKADKKSDIDESIGIVWLRLGHVQTIVECVHNEVGPTAANEFVSDYYKIKGA